MEQNEQLHKIRHSSAHLLAYAVKSLFKDVKVAIGPVIDTGFYYDFDFLGKKPTEEDLPKIEAEMARLLKTNFKFEQKWLTVSEARELFKDEPYKLELISEIEKGERDDFGNKGQVGTYTSGEFVDLCKGPHVENVSEIKAFKLFNLAGAYWKGSEKNKMLTRIYGTAFESQKEQEDYLKMMEEAKKRDHKKLGPQLGLFFIDETAPGMPYWLPKGTTIINELLRFWREEHIKRDYLETITPQLNKKQLYETSGHWEHYRDNMFICDMGKDDIYCLKPMNCPNAMTIYKQGIHSYRDLPLRLSDCDALHRHEKSGELSGLLRVQKFAQDDAHIFVTEDQIAEEYKRILEIANLFYSIFKINFKIRLGTRPTDFMGDIETWNKAEKELEEILIKNKFDYFIGEGEGAFYGPKLDILMEDCIGRQWQTGTIQLDFQLPRNFDLKYTDKDGQEKTPVVIHRVIYGSLERFVGILIEQFAGAFPLWLSPVQVSILNVSEKSMDYSKELYNNLRLKFRVDLDASDETIGNKIRKAQEQKTPFMLIIGEREKNDGKISVRARSGQQMNGISLEEFESKLTNLINSKSLELK